MIYLYIFSLLAALSVILTYRSRRAALQRKLETIRAKWGHPTSGYRNFELIAAYSETHPKPVFGTGNLDDIDFQRVFEFIDRTDSKIGQQCLYDRLLRQAPDLAELQEFDHSMAYFETEKEITELTEIELSKLNSSYAYFLHKLFTQEHRPFYKGAIKLYIYLAWPIVSILLISLIIIPNQYSFVGLLSALIANLLLHFRNKKYLFQYINSLPQLLSLMTVAGNIARITGRDREKIGQHINHLKTLKRGLRFINTDNALINDPSDLSYLTWELIKMCLLLEPLSFILSLKHVSHHRQAIRELFEYVGQTDVAIAVCSLRFGLPYYCKPEFRPNDGPARFSELYHPLVENCVANSLDLDIDKGILLTGSNMSGKTTFIRAVSINVLLSQALFTSCSKQYSAPLLGLNTSIRVNDDMENNISYFQAEALEILSIIEVCRKRKPANSLVIIDEIFRGTNTIERIAAAKAVLSYLIASKNFVIVSTHDLELAELLGKEYDTYSFEESVARERLVFDYKLKPGLLKNKNGLAILKGIGYPESIIIEAAEVSDDLVQKHDRLKEIF